MGYGSSAKGKIFQQKKRKRAKLWENQNGLCDECGKKMLNRERLPMDANHPDDATLDHIQPKSKGGTNNIKNLRLVCYSCNFLKSDKWEPTLLELETNAVA
jgi:5-methylcytosine-specific restriction endonuclease McrA